MTTHINTISTTKQYCCEVEGCGKILSSASTLNVHKRTHTKERPFICDVQGCDKSYKGITALKEHKLTHTGEKPHTCPVDCFIDMGEYTIFVEVDENQHVSYDCLRGNKRTMQLFQDTGNRPLYLIRFNPDDYLDENNANITSCWGTNKLGVCVIKKTKQHEWQSRLDVLKECLTSCIDSPPTKEVDVMHLYYDVGQN